MAIGTASGLVGTADPTQNQLKIDMRDAITYLDVDTTQFTSMLMHPKFGSERAKSFKVEWLNNQYIPRHSALSASAADSLTTIPLTTGEGAYARAGDIIRIPSTGEAMRVTLEGATNLGVVRAVGSVAAASAASGAKAVIVGGSAEQGATLPTRLIAKTTADYNYTQIHRNAYGFTETALATDWYGGDLAARARKDTAVQHKWDIELTLFFGARSYTVGTKPRHTSGGLIEYITSSTDAGGTFDKAEIQDFLRAGLQYGNRNMKVLFAAPVVCQVFGEFLQDNWVRATPDEKVWGVTVDYIIGSAFGAKVPVVCKADWMRFGEGTAGEYGSMAFLVDMGFVQYAPLRDTVLKPGRQANDADEQTAEYITECSLKVEVPEAHRKLINVTG